MINNNKQVFSRLVNIGDTTLLPRNGRSDATLRTIVSVQASRKRQVLTVLDRAYPGNGWLICLSALQPDTPRWPDGPLKVTHDAMGRQTKPPYDHAALSAIQDAGDTATIAKAGRPVGPLTTALAKSIGCSLSLQSQTADSFTLMADMPPAHPIRPKPLPAYVWDAIKAPGGYIDLPVAAVDAPAARARLARQARKLHLTVRIKLIDNPLHFRVSL